MFFVGTVYEVVTTATPMNVKLMSMKTRDQRGETEQRATLSAPAAFGRSPARVVRVRFDTPEFFDLMSRIPQGLTWALARRNLSLTHGDTVYEIYE